MAYLAAALASSLIALVVARVSLRRIDTMPTRSPFGGCCGLCALIVAGLIVILLFFSWARPFGLVGMVLSWGG
jgi:hypothetical protein